jgi:hypothetical protein
MSFGPSLPDLYRRAADFVDKILRGTKPADIPVEQPTKFDIVINLTTAKGARSDRAADFAGDLDPHLSSRSVTRHGSFRA